MTSPGEYEFDVNPEPVHLELSAATGWMVVRQGQSAPVWIRRGFADSERVMAGLVCLGEVDTSRLRRIRPKDVMAALEASTRPEGATSELERALRAWLTGQLDATTPHLGPDERMGGRRISSDDLQEFARVLDEEMRDDKRHAVANTARRLHLSRSGAYNRVELLRRQGALLADSEATETSTVSDDGAPLPEEDAGILAAIVRDPVRRTLPWAAPDIAGKADQSAAERIATDWSVPIGTAERWIEELRARGLLDPKDHPEIGEDAAPSA